MSHALLSHGTRYGVWLWTLWAAFGFRAAAQLLQQVHPVAALPRLDAWHSAALPYPVLLAVQVMIIILFAYIAQGVWRGTTRRRPLLGQWLRRLGGFYFAGMVARLALGLTVLSGHHWFDKPVPTLFHLVLAGFLLVLASYHSDTEGTPGAERRA